MTAFPSLLTQLIIKCIDGVSAPPCEQCGSSALHAKRDLSRIFSGSLCWSIISLRANEINISMGIPKGANWFLAELECGRVVEQENSQSVSGPFLYGFTGGILKHPLLLYEAAALCIKYADHFFIQHQRWISKLMGRYLNHSKGCCYGNCGNPFLRSWAFHAALLRIFEQNAVLCHIKPMYTHVHTLRTRPVYWGLTCMVAEHRKHFIVLVRTPCMN